MSLVRAEDTVLIQDKAAAAPAFYVNVKFVEIDAAGDPINLIGGAGDTETEADRVYDLITAVVGYNILESNSFASPVYAEGTAPVVKSDNRPG